MNQLIERGWLTHLATNGAGTIHDWELAFLGRTEESVRKNVATGTFGTWDETGRYIHLALLAGALRAEGYGRSLGRFICEDGVTLPTTASLEAVAARRSRSHPLAPARAELLQAMLSHRLPAGRIAVKHPWKETSILAQAFRHNVPLTVHPGIGYDIIATHPMFNGAAIGRAAAMDFACSAARWKGWMAAWCCRSARPSWRRRCSRRASVASTICGCRPGGRSSTTTRSTWWTSRTAATGIGRKGEPPKDNPAYYLRFCKSFSRMGGRMNYVAVRQRGVPAQPAAALLGHERSNRARSA